MKLYTEEELRKSFIEGHKRGWLRAVYKHPGRTNKDADEFLNENELTSIKLPTDEEIRKESHDYFIRGQLGFEAASDTERAFLRGILWMREKIQGGIL